MSLYVSKKIAKRIFCSAVLLAMTGCGSGGTRVITQDTSLLRSDSEICLDIKIEVNSSLPTSSSSQADIAESLIRLEKVLSGYSQDAQEPLKRFIDMTVKKIKDLNFQFQSVENGEAAKEILSDYFDSWGLALENLFVKCAKSGVSMEDTTTTVPAIATKCLAQWDRAHRETLAGGFSSYQLSRTAYECMNYSEWLRGAQMYGEWTNYLYESLCALERQSPVCLDLRDK